MYIFSSRLLTYLSCSSGHFFSLSHQERERREKERMCNGHSFIHFSCCTSVRTYLPIIIIAKQEKRRERKKSVSIIIITLLRILSFSILSIYNRIDPLFLCLSLYSLFINSFLSGSRRRRHTFVC